MRSDRKGRGLENVRVKDQSLKLITQLIQPMQQLNSGWRGRCLLGRLLKKGLPEYFRSPLSYILTGKLSSQDKVKLNRIEEVRGIIAEREGEISVYQSPETDPRNGIAEGPTKDRPFERTAYTTSISPKWGTFFIFVLKVHVQEQS